MIRGLSLRARVTVLYMLMGFILSLLFACAAAFIVEDYERILVREILNTHAQDWAVRIEHDPGAELPRTEGLSVYVRHHGRSPEEKSDIPAYLSALPVGIHQAEDGSAAHDGSAVHIGVFDTIAGRLYFEIDLQHIEMREYQFFLMLVAIVVFGTLISALLGWLLSANVVRPIRRLADAVEALPSRPVLTELGRGAQPDELGRLSMAIDDYQSRLVSAEQVEQAFFADASHELRTPIAVIRGASELLLDDSAQAANLRPRLFRLDRGIRDISELLDALFILARQRPAEIAHVALVEWLGACLAGADSIRNSMVRFIVKGDEEVMSLAASDAELIVRCLVRRLIPPEARGLLEATVSARTMVFRFSESDSAPAPARPALSRFSDRRLGLTVMGRLAQKNGWAIDDARIEEGQVSIRLAPPNR